MPRLRRADCSQPGFARRRRGKGFEYLDQNGQRLRDTATLERIRSLVIPPAWTDVWICPHPFGHLQAVGTDAAGRRQYLYHSAWRARRDQEKFDHMLAFARALPGLRETASEHLAQEGMPRERVLACAVRLLDRGFFRVGTEEYTEQNDTFGLATMRREHVAVEGDAVVFEYVAKGGKERIQSIVDPDVRDVVHALKRRRGGGRELLAYQLDGRWRDVRSPDVNAYIKELTGDDFSAKDFRTWHATVLAALALAVGRPPASPTARKRAVTRAIEEVAHYLGNTPTVCRTSYIDPRVFDRFRAGATIAGVVGQLGAVDVVGSPEGQGVVEQAVLDLLEENPSPAVVRDDEVTEPVAA